MKKSRLFLAGIGCAVSLCSCDGEEMILETGISPNPPLTYEMSLNDALTDDGQDVIMVYVCGAVQTPGVVALDAESRVVDAIGLAGGMTNEADADYMNLAAKLKDGEKIYVPTTEEVLLWEKNQKERGLINLNTADKEALCTLPGIGESKAQDIIAYREEYGEFQTPEDIMKVPGIKENLFQKIKSYVKVE